jgi:hypothetical protein
MRNGSDRESNLRPQMWQALVLISNIDLTTAPLWQPNRGEWLLASKTKACYATYRPLALHGMDKTVWCLPWWVWHWYSQAQGTAWQENESWKLRCPWVDRMAGCYHIWFYAHVEPRVRTASLQNLWNSDWLPLGETFTGLLNTSHDREGKAPVLHVSLQVCGRH